MKPKDLPGYSFSLFSRPERGDEGMCIRPDLEEHLRQSLSAILLTTVGERPLDPAFGSQLQKFIYARINPTLLKEIAQEVRVSLERCEPRVQIAEVVVNNEQGDPSRLEIKVLYQIRNYTEGASPGLSSFKLPMRLLE